MKSRGSELIQRAPVGTSTWAVRLLSGSEAAMRIDVLGGPLGLAAGRRPDRQLRAFFHFFSSPGFDVRFGCVGVPKNEGYFQATKRNSAVSV